MPELPEIETIKRGLESEVIGYKFHEIVVRQPQLRWLVDTAKLESDIIGHKITSLSRRAKYLLINLSNGKTLIVHLGMSGKLFWQTEPHHLIAEKHDHFIFHLKKINTSARFVYNDARRFGYIATHRTDTISGSKFFKHLGPEPLSSELAFDSFAGKYPNSTRPIKNFIMDATKIVGVGNIYACEALFKAKIHPHEPVKNISAKKWHCLIEAIKKTLNRAIELGGTTFRSYQRSDGSLGYFQNELSVYQRENQDCLDCGGKIQRSVQQNRSTFFCPICQKLSS